MNAREPNILRIAAKKTVEDLGPTLQQPSIAFADPAAAIWYQGGTSHLDVLTAALTYARRLAKERGA